MRLFVAIDVDADAREHVAAEQRRVRQLLGDASSITWTAASLIHVTLVFIGNVPDARGQDIVAASAEPIRGVAPFRAAFGGLGVFPAHGAPRVLWLGVSEGAEHIARVHEVVRQRIERLGIPTENRPFHAHLTLGRWRDARPRDRRSVEDIGGHKPIASSEVRDAALYQSRLSSSGPAYTVLARSPLI
jgi:2'-5' RNA ligase